LQPARMCSRLARTLNHSPYAASTRSSLGNNNKNNNTQMHRAGRRCSAQPTHAHT